MAHGSAMNVAVSLPHVSRLVFTWISQLLGPLLGECTGYLPVLGGGAFSPPAQGPVGSPPRYLSPARRSLQALWRAKRGAHSPELEKTPVQLDPEATDRLEIPIASPEIKVAICISTPATAVSHSHSHSFKDSPGVAFFSFPFLAGILGIQSCQFTIFSIPQRI